MHWRCWDGFVGPKAHVFKCKAAVELREEVRLATWETNMNDPDLRICSVQAWILFFQGFFSFLACDKSARDFACSAQRVWSIVCMFQVVFTRKASWSVVNVDSDDARSHTVVIFVYQSEQRGLPSWQDFLRKNVSILCFAFVYRVIEAYLMCHHRTKNKRPRRTDDSQIYILHDYKVSEKRVSCVVICSDVISFRAHDGM